MSTPPVLLLQQERTRVVEEERVLSGLAVRPQQLPVLIGEAISSDGRHGSMLRRRRRACLSRQFSSGRAAAVELLSEIKSRRTTGVATGRPVATHVTLPFVEVGNSLEVCPLQLPPPFLNPRPFGIRPDDHQIERTVRVVLYDTGDLQAKNAHYIKHRYTVLITYPGTVQLVVKNGAARLHVHGTGAGNEGWVQACFVPAAPAGPRSPRQWQWLAVAPGAARHGSGGGAVEDESI